MGRFPQVHTLLLTAMLIGAFAPTLGRAQTPTPTTDTTVAADATRVAPTLEVPAASAIPLPQAVLKPPVDAITDAPPPVLEQPRQAIAEAPAKDQLADSLKAAPLEESDLPLPINLAAALRLADARPVVVIAAQAALWVAEAQLQRAKLVLVPMWNMGASYTRHDGYGPDFNRGNNNPFSITSTKLPLNQNINFFYAGGGFSAYANVADAIFLPLAARQVVKSAEANIQAARNDALLMTALAYFNVHEARGRYAGAVDVVERGKTLVARINELSKDLVPKVEVDRARNVLADLEQQAASAREAWRVQSANLTQVLRLDPRAVIVPLEHDHMQITLIDPARPVDDLIPIGLTHRPELASQQSLVQAALLRIRQEKLRPVLPSVVINGFQTPGMLLQFGIVAIGADKSMNNWGSRDDISLQLVWQFEGLGFGNLGRIREQRGEQSRTLVRLFKIQDAVATDIQQTQAEMQSASVRVIEAERALREALVTYNGNYEGLRQTKRFENVLVQVYRPQEVVTALEHLKTAYDQYFMTVADYNRAQFRMFHALGYPGSELANLRPPGELAPVNTERPSYLPTVGFGPPAATR